MTHVNERRLALHTGYDQGRSKLWQGAWFATQNLVFEKFWFPRRWRPALLRAFGAEIGEGVVIRYRVRVMWPWRLTIGNDSWVGEGSWLYNVADLTIGSDVCVSQEVFLCTGSHDPTTIDFAVRNTPIVVQDGVWIGAQAQVLSGVTVGEGATIGLGATVSKDVPAGTVVVAPRAVELPRR